MWHSLKVVKWTAIMMNTPFGQLAHHTQMGKVEELILQKAHVRIKCFGGYQIHSDARVRVALCELLQIQGPIFQCDGNFKFMPRWDERILVLRDFVEK
jgi:hypothetical protein